MKLLRTLRIALKSPQSFNILNGSMTNEAPANFPPLPSSISTFNILNGSMTNEAVRVLFIFVVQMGFQYPQRIDDQ